MQHDHFVVEDAALTLSSVDDHTLLVHGGTVVLPGASRETLRLHCIHCSFVNVKFK